MLDYKVKLVHLFSRPEDEREIESFKSISKLQNFGIEYIKNINEPYDNLPPSFNCARPSDISKEPGFMKITGRHYGCFMAFRNAIEQHFEEEDDFLIICECDCILEIYHDDFIKLLNKVCKTIIETKIDYFSFGDKHVLSTNELVSPIIGKIHNADYMYITNKIIGCQMIMFPKSSKTFLKEMFLGEPWDGVDLYFNRVFNKYKKRIGIINERVTTQHSGISLLDNKLKLFTDKKGMIENLLELYENVKINPQEIRNIKNQIGYHFVGQPKVIINGSKPEKYHVTFTDSELNEVLFENDIQTGWHTTVYRQWFTKWNIKVENIRTKEIELDYTLNLENKRVYISFESKSLGDTLAWIPYVEEFRKKHNCILFVSTHWNNLFKTEYPNITFTEPGTAVDNLLAMYFIGIFNSGVWDPNRNPTDCRLIPLQKVASDILGIEYEEIKPKIKLSNKKKNIYKRYVCIAPNATMQCKYWNYKGAWQQIVDYLKSIGYEVMLISKEKDFMGNTAPYRVIDKSGNRMIEDRIRDLQYADLYIGLGSGLSWLSWAVGTPTIMITGYTEPWYEFQSETIIHNSNVCNGCFNDSSIPFEKHWTWCPREKNFECTSTIEPKEVIDAINKILKR